MVPIISYKSVAAMCTPLPVLFQKQCSFCVINGFTLANREYLQELIPEDACALACVRETQCHRLLQHLAGCQNGEPTLRHVFDTGIALRSVANLDPDTRAAVGRQQGVNAEPFNTSSRCLKKIVAHLFKRITNELHCFCWTASASRN